MTHPSQVYSVRPCWLAACLLVLALLAFARWVQPWQVVDDDGLPPDGAALTVAAGDQGHTFDIPSPAAWEGWVAQARVRVDGLVPGPKSWDEARVLVFFLDAGGRARWQDPHTLSSLHGSSDWLAFSAGFTVPAGATALRLRVENRGLSGTMEVVDLHLWPAVHPARYTWGRVLLAGAWAGLLLACLVRLRLWRRRHGWLLTLLVVAISVGVAAPADPLDAALHAPVRLLHRPARQVARVADDGAPPTVDVAEAVAVPAKTSKRPSAVQQATWRQEDDQARVLQKSGHAGLFFLLGLTAVLSLGARRPRWREVGLLLGALALFAAYSEACQLLTPFRDARLLDGVLDLAGAVLGSVLAVFARWVGRGADR